MSNIPSNTIILNEDDLEIGEIYNIQTPRNSTIAQYERNTLGLHKFRVISTTENIGKYYLVRYENNKRSNRTITKLS